MHKEAKLMLTQSLMWYHWIWYFYKCPLW